MARLACDIYIIPTYMTLFHGHRSDTTVGTIGMSHFWCKSLTATQYLVHVTRDFATDTHNWNIEVFMSSNKRRDVLRGIVIA